MAVPRRFLLAVTAVVLAAVILFFTGPPSPIQLSTPARPETIRGAFHIHTTQSDGALDRAQVAAAAARAGLQFAVFTDHGDATRPPAPPEYVHGVLCIDAVEISTNDGHLVALGIPASPYPLGGDAKAVLEDVERLGGFGVAAHPFSAREELAWSDWSAPIHGLEWLNADSEWRDEGRLRLVRGFLDYFWRPAGALAALFDRPDNAFERWDQIAAERRLIGIAGHDAHGGFGAETDGRTGRRVHIPSYEAAFRTFSVSVTLPHAPTGTAGEDGGALLEAIRQGRAFTTVDAIATPGALEFTASAGAAHVTTGAVLPAGDETARFSVRAVVPPGATTVLLRNGRPAAHADGGQLDHADSRPGAYRVEVRVPSAPGSPPIPWIVTNPIYRFPPQGGAARPSVSLVSRGGIPEDRWRAEFDPDSSALVLRDQQEVGLWFRLREGEEASQFAALVTDIDGVPDGATHLSFRGRADRPMRVSVQLRFANGGGARWRQSVYLDPSTREAVVPLEALRAADGSGRPVPPLQHATSVLFVVDLTNARPGQQGSFALEDVRFAQHGGALPGSDLDQTQVRRGSDTRPQAGH